MSLPAMLLPLLMSFSSPNFANEESFERGVRERTNSSEARNWFAKAAEGYRNLWQVAQGRNEALMWGRSSYLAGDNPTAVAAFRAGLAHFPGDAELLSGLRHCRAEALANGVAATPTEGFRNRLAPRHRWLWAFVGVSLVSFGVWNRFTVRWRLGSVLFVFGLAGILGLIAGEWQCQRERNEDRDFPPCVVRGESALRTGNGETYPPRLPALLPAGTEVRRVAERGGWIQVQLLTGEIGWLPEEMVLKVLPRY